MDSLGPLPELHEREGIVRSAEASLMECLLEWQKEWGTKVTTAEYLSVMQRAFSKSMATCLKYVIRKERHGTTDKPGGVE